MKFQRFLYLALATLWLYALVVFIHMFGTAVVAVYFSA
jgi:hypothetical protein